MINTTAVGVLLIVQSLPPAPETVAPAAATGAAGVVGNAYGGNAAIAEMLAEIAVRYDDSGDLTRAGAYEGVRTWEQAAACIFAEID